MLYTVRRAGVPVGRVSLPWSELAAAPLIRLPAYSAIEQRVRAASQALLEYGFYGPPISAITDPARKHARLALAAGATLHLELASVPEGRLVPTTFVNLIESPDRGVIVVVRFREQSVGHMAMERSAPPTLPNASNPPAW